MRHDRRCATSKNTFSLCLRKLAVQMSALGQKQTCFTPNSDRKSGFPHRVMSALPPKADTCSALAYVCLGPKADIDSVHSITSSARIAGKAWLPNIATAQSASTSDHLSLDCGQSEQQDYPER